MTEEKKEIAAEAPQAAVLPPKPAEVKKEAPAPKKEKPSNCAGCNKSIKKKRWYYRSGKFYCTKRCWRSTQKKKEEKAPEAQDKK